jgi:hypothetical protein
MTVHPLGIEQQTVFGLRPVEFATLAAAEPASGQSAGTVTERRRWL